MNMTAFPIDNQFDESFADQLARLESFNKHHYRPNTYLHKWWARRCGSTFRLILKHLVDDAALQNYYTPGGLDGKLILDPMMGGATTLHEAIRMGANVIGADLDPIPVLQARASLSDVPLIALEKAFRQFYQRMWKDLEPFYLTISPVSGTAVPINYTLYGLKRSCACSSVLVVDSFILRHETDGSILRICPHCHDLMTDDVPCCDKPHPDKLMLVERTQKQCPTCEQPYEEDVHTPFYARYVPLVIVGTIKGRKQFMKSLDDADHDLVAEINNQRESIPFERDAFAVDRGRKSKQLHYRGVDNYLDLFSTRQLMFLEKAIAHLRPFPHLVQLNLGMLVSTSLEFNSMLCGYKGKNKRRAGAIRHTFSHHAYSFPYMALENNPLHPRKASGTLQKLFQSRIRNGRSWAMRPRERRVDKPKVEFTELRGEVDAGKEVTDLTQLKGGSRNFYLRQGSSTDLPLADSSVDFIVTDPPYFDSVQYSDLSTYFRVWLRHLLPDATDWDVDMSQSAVDPHKLDRESRYRELLSGIFAECYRVIDKENGRFIFTFHHYNPKAWAALTVALQSANFRLVNRYVVHSENPISVHINNMKSLMHDAILVLAPVDVAEDVQWKRPSSFNTQNSEQFCRDCATLVGWVLENNVPTSEIDAIWKNAY
jgi:putative DNA methylase